MLCVLFLLVSVDVTSEAGRKQTLLEYVAQREDLTAAEKAEWDKTLRLTFGGKALKDGREESVTAAKSVIAAGIFYRMPQAAVAQAAYDAHNDVLSWVPPPVAIHYQILKLEGRPPKEGSRLIALNFPRYFNEELAAEYVGFWGKMLDEGKVSSQMLPSVERQVRETRALMRPMMLTRLWLLADLEARLDAIEAARLPKDPVVLELKVQLAALRLELDRDFKKVSAGDVASAPAYDRYVVLAKELKQAPQARPAYVKERPLPTAPKKPPPIVREKPAERPPPVIAEKTPNTPVDLPTGDLRPAPLVGDPLIPVTRGYDRVVEKSVEGWLGTPYLLGGTTHSGIDCSAFVREVFRESQKVELPRTATQQATTGVSVDSPALRNGDILLFDILERGRVSHVGVFMGDGIFVHASSSRGVTRDQFAAKWVQRAFRGSRRILEAP